MIISHHDLHVLSSGITVRNIGYICKYKFKFWPNIPIPNRSRWSKYRTNSWPFSNNLALPMSSRQIAFLPPFGQYPYFPNAEIYPQYQETIPDEFANHPKPRNFQPHPRAEPTTERPAHLPDIFLVKPEKFQTKQQVVADFRLFSAQQRPDNTFDLHQFNNNKQSQRYVFESPDNDVPVVTATAMSSADAPNEIDFGDGPYVLGGHTKGATLLLQPSAKAISGNGGTSISAPVSRAILRKNSGTRVIFRPESVAIAGVGGTAHAQADLILDYYE